MPTDKTYKVGNDIYDIPYSEVKAFLKDNPQAVEVKSFVVGKDTFDIPLPEVRSFQKDMPSAKPLKKKEPSVSSGGASTSTGVPKPNETGITEVQLPVADVKAQGTTAKPEAQQNTPTESDLSNERQSVRPDSYFPPPDRLTSAELNKIDKNLANTLYQHNLPNATEPKGQTEGELNATRRRQQASLQGAILSLEQQKQGMEFTGDDLTTYNPERVKLDKEIQAKREQLKLYKEPVDFFDRIPNSDKYAANKPEIQHYLKNMEVADPEGFKLLNKKAEKGLLSEHDYFSYVVDPALRTQMEISNQDYEILKNRGVVHKAQMAATLIRDLEELQAVIEANPQDEQLKATFMQKDEQLKTLQDPQIDELMNVIAKGDAVKQSYGEAILAIGKEIGLVPKETVDVTDDMPKNVLKQLDLNRRGYGEGMLKVFAESVAGVMDDIDALGKFAAAQTGLGDILLDPDWEKRKGIAGQAATELRDKLVPLNDMPETWTGTMLSTAIPMTALIAEMAMFPEIRSARLAKATGGVVKAIPAFTTMEGTLGGIRAWDELVIADNPDSFNVKLETLKGTAEGAAMGTGLHFLGAFGGETSKFVAKYVKGNFVPSASAFATTGTMFGTLDAFEQYLQTGKVDVGQSTAVGVGASVLSAPHVMKALATDAYKKAHLHFATSSKEVIQKAQQMPASAEELLNQAVELNKEGKTNEANILNTMANVKMAAEDIVANPEKAKKDIEQSNLTDKENEFYLNKIDETVKFATELRTTEDKAVQQDQGQTPQEVTAEGKSAEDTGGVNPTFEKKKLESDPDLAKIDQDLIAARNGDVDLQKSFEEYGIDWRQTTTYRFVGQSEVDVLLSNNKVESKRFTDAGIDVTTSPKPTTSASNEYRVTFKESFDVNNGLGKVKLKNKDIGDHNLEKGRGYSLNDVQKIERLDENGNVSETIYDAELAPQANTPSGTVESKTEQTTPEKVQDTPASQSPASPDVNDQAAGVNGEYAPLKMRGKEWNFTGKVNEKNGDLEFADPDGNTMFVAKGVAKAVGEPAKPPAPKREEVAQVADQLPDAGKVIPELSKPDKSEVANKGKAIEPNKEVKDEVVKPTANEGAAKTFEAKHKIPFNDFHSEVQANLKIFNGDINYAIEKTLSDRDMPSDYHEKAKVLADYTKAFLESELPTKLLGKKAQLDISDIEGEIAVRPIESKQPTFKSKEESLKGIVSKDEMRPTMGGIHKDSENKAMVATDAHKLVVIPDNSITKTETVNPKTGEIIEGKYPNYKDVIPYNPNVVKIDNVDELLNNLNGVERADKFVTGGQFVARLEYGDMEVFVDAGYIKSVIQALRYAGIKSFQFELANTSDRAIVIKDATGKNKALGLVMPILGESAGKKVAHKTVFKGEIAPESRQRQIDMLKKEITFNQESPSYSEKFAQQSLDKAIKNNNEWDIAYYTNDLAAEKSRRLAKVEKLKEQLKELEDGNAEIKPESTTVIPDNTEREAEVKAFERKAEVAGSFKKEALEKIIADIDKVIEPEVKPVNTDVKTVVDKYGWDAKVNDKGNTELFNKNGKMVATIQTKGDKYTILDSGGEKLMTGKGQIGKSVEKLLNDHFYAKEVKVEPVKPEPKPDVKKEPWQMKREEYDVKPIKAGPAEISHRFFIEKAISEGKTIPQEVLADYPKLAEKVAPKAPDKPKELTTIPDLQEALQQRKITLEEYNKRVEEIRKQPAEKDFYEKTIDVLDSMKIDTKGQMYDATLGIPIVAWNASIDIIKAGVKGGKIVADAIKEAIDYLKSKNINFDEAKYEAFYKDIFDKKEAELRKEVTDRLPEEFKAIETQFFGSPTPDEAGILAKKKGGVIGMANKILGLPQVMQEKIFAQAYDKLGDKVAIEAAKQAAARNGLARNSTAIIRGLVKNLTKTNEQVATAEAFAGIVKDKSVSDAHRINDLLHKYLGTDKEKYSRINRVLDPDFYRERTREEFEQELRDAEGDEAIDKMGADKIDTMYDEFRTAMDYDNKKELQFSDLTPDEQIVHDQLRFIYDFTHDVRFSIGQIDADTYIKNKGKYAARLYDTFEMPEDVSKEMKKAGIKMDLGGTQARGPVNLWKAGHIVEDPIYAASKRLMQAQVNKAIYDYSHYVFNQKDAVSKVEKDGYTKLQGRSYGKLNEKWVRNDYVEDFKGFFFSNAVLDGTYRIFKNIDSMGVVQFYKSLLTRWNPGVRVGNFTGGVVFANTLGINPLRFLANYQLFAKGEIKNYGETYRHLLSKGLLNSDYTKQDLVQSVKDLDNINNIAASSTNPIALMGRFNTWINETYSRVDELGKIAAYKSLIDLGLTPEQALNRTANGFQNFKRVGKLYDIYSKTPLLGNRFGKFQGDLMRIIKTGVQTRPLNYAAFLGTLYGMGFVASYFSDETEEDKKIRESRVGAPKVKTPIVDIPLSFKMGGNELNIARFISPFYIYSTPDEDDIYQSLLRVMPYGLDFIDKTNNPDGKWGVFVAKNVKDPLLAPLAQWFVDSDFRGMPILDPKETKWEKSRITPTERNINAARFLARAYVPYGSFGDDFIRAMMGEPDYYGREKTPTQVALRFLGYNSQVWQDERYNNIVTGKIKKLSREFADNGASLHSLRKDYNSGDIRESQYIERGNYLLRKNAELLSEVQKEAEKFPIRMSKLNSIELLNKNIAPENVDRFLKFQAGIYEMRYRNSLMKNE